MAELDRVDIAIVADANLVDSGKAAREVFDFSEELKAKQQQPQRNMEAGGGNGARSPGPGMRTEIFGVEAKVRFDRALEAETGFVERLVWFWSNHFCVSAEKVRAFAGAFEREAIRPHVLGRFADMLLAVETHPAMLVYLDNVRSTGPDSIVGQERHIGFNENLAREIMELHTLGVRTGYSQADVSSFAKVITGWTIFPPRDRQHGGEFRFNPRMHEPGPQTVTGRTYAGAGVDQGTDVLRDLAHNPETATHIATKFARHFVADEPPPAVVEALKTSFRNTDGDLKELARTLLSSAEAWEAPRSKLKRPGEWLVAAARATGVAAASDVWPMLHAQESLGEPLWQPPAPNGFDDVKGAWLDGVGQRVDIANQIAQLITAPIDPDELVESALGPLASAETREAVARAETRPHAAVLLLMSSEFQRR